MHIFSKFNACNMNTHTCACTHTHTVTHTLWHTTNFVPNTHVSTADEDTKPRKQKALLFTAEFGERVLDSKAWGVAWTPGTRVHSRLCFAARLVLGVLQQCLVWGDDDVIQTLVELADNVAPAHPHTSNRSNTGHSTGADPCIWSFIPTYLYFFSLFSFCNSG